MDFLKWLMPLVLFTACGKSGDDHSNPGPGPSSEQPVAQSLSELAPRELIKAKYNKAQFACDLWVQRGAAFIKSNAPNDRFVWDLLNDFAQEKTFQLRGEAQDHRLEATVSVKSIEIIGRLRHTTADMKVYKAVYTPVIKMIFKYSQETTHSHGEWTKGNGYVERGIYEKIRAMLLNRIHSIDGSTESYFDYLECTIDTDIKPEYQDQFSAETP